MNDLAKRNLRNVMVMALADEELAQGEREYIDRLRVKLGVDAEEFRQLCDDLRERGKRLEISTRQYEQTETLELLVETAAADGVIQPAEQELLGRLAEKLGMSRRQLSEQIQHALHGTEVDEMAIQAAVDEIYEQFESWDDATRQAKLDAIAAEGHGAVIPLLRMLESYRKPDGAADALEMKTLIARTLGKLLDSRSAYYLAQEVNIGDVDDEVTNTALRYASAEALGKIIERDFTPDQEGVKAARAWWQTPDAKKYDRLAF